MSFTTASSLTLGRLKRLMIIEDNKRTARALEILLSPHARVYVAHTIDQADAIIIEWAKEEPLTSDDVVLVDYYMPTDTDPTPKGEYTRDFLARHILNKILIRFIACSKGHNEELRKWGCVDELPFAGMAGVDAEAFCRLVCNLLGVTTPDKNAPLA